MSKIVVINHKMNLSYEEVTSYITNIKDEISDIFEVVICPSSIYLTMFKNSGYKLGAQNVYYENKGPYTGEISPTQLKSIGVDYVIVGHSDRRINFNEDNDLIAKKLIASIHANLRPVLCVGETREEKALKRTVSVLKRQVSLSLAKVDKDDLHNIIIAYEPVWAISNGRITATGELEKTVTPSLEEIEDAITYIKEIVKKEYDVDIRVIYGGSVDENNIKEVMSIKNADGILIGGASLNPLHLIKILDIVD